MKDIIMEFFQKEKKARQKTINIEAYVLEKMGEAYEERGGYEQFCASIDGLVEEKIIRPIAAWKINRSLTPPLYNGYQYRKKQKATDPLFIRELLTRYHNKIDMIAYLQNEDLFHSDKLYLEQLHSFLQTPSDGYLISMNERSFDIFKDEKFLASKPGKEFLNRVKLDIEDLHCYPTYEQFFHYQKSVNPKTLLIIENKDTYDSLKRLMLEGVDTWFKVRFDMLIYGEGDKILRSFSFLKELGIYEYQGYYFGDLDPKGISLCTHVMEMSQEKIQPFTPFYSFLLNNYERVERKTVRPMSKRKIDDNLAIFLPFFHKKEQEKICQVITRNGHQQGYLPQEGLHKKILFELSLKDEAR